MNESMVIATLAREGISLALDADENIKVASKTGKVDTAILTLLKSHKTFLITWLKGQVAKNDFLNRIDSTTELPPSAAQERFFWVEKMNAENFSAFNLSLVYLFRGKLNRNALIHGWQSLVNRHDVLRSLFFETQEGLRVRISNVTAENQLKLIKEIDVSFNDELALKKLFSANAEKKFNLINSPLYRVFLIRVDDDTHYLQIVLHHAIFDGWSGQVLIQDLANFYNGFCNKTSVNLPDLSLNYYECIYQSLLSDEKKINQSSQYWQEKLKNAPAHTTLPHEGISNSQLTGACIDFSFSADVRLAIRSLAMQCGVTPYLLLLSVFKLCLARFIGVDDIVVGSPVANRDDDGRQNLIGLFVNTLVLRTQLGAEDDIAQFAQKVKSTYLDALTHQCVTFEKIVEIVNPDRNAHTSPIFQTLFIYHDFAESFDGFDGLKLAPVEQELQSAFYDLTLQFQDRDDIFQGSILYRADLYSRTVMEQFVRVYETLLKQILLSPQARLQEIPLL
ncbi:MAG: condensation domain-containing protein, partial [Pseudomonadota bacterium]